MMLAGCGVVLGAVALTSAGSWLVLRGGRGDVGDGKRHVVLPTPRRSVIRLVVFVAAVLAWSALVARDYAALAGVIKSALGLLMVASGLSLARADAYLVHTNPLLLLLEDGSLVALVVARRHTLRSLLRSLLVLAVFLVGAPLVVVAADVVAGWLGVPAAIVFYLGELVSLAAGFLALLVLVFLTAALPRRYDARSGVHPLASSLLLVGIFALMLVLAGALARGIGASLSTVSPPDGLLVFLTLPSLVMLTSAVLLLARPKDRPGVGDPAEPIDVIMPAFNEQAGIGATLEALDRAAAAYPGRVRVLVADDGSSDATAAVIEEAARRAQAAEIVALLGPHGGKSFALNRALEAAQTRIVVRVDADILVDARCLRPLPHWFANPAIGCIGAFDLPNFSLPAWYTKGRLFECLMTFGFSRLAFERLDANNVPGTFMAFRRKEALALGGFVEGMNGEDSDLTFNLGKLGLRSVIDPRIVIYEDVPQTLGAFIEQRTRWSRASFHVGARHLPWQGRELHPRMLIQLRFLFNKLTSMIRPVTYVSSALFFLLIPRVESSPLRTLVLLALTLAPQLVLIVAASLYWGFWRELRHLWVWVPFSIARKLGLISGILSLPPLGSVEHRGPARREEVATSASAR
jgi:cellulose synthase/poly-beta-1,6-N-acetylglucosamine synthase-like glycosyltransferase